MDTINLSISTLINSTNEQIEVVRNLITEVNEQYPELTSIVNNNHTELLAELATQINTVNNAVTNLNGEVDSQFITVTQLINDRISNFNTALNEIINLRYSAISGEPIADGLADKVVLLEAQVEDNVLVLSNINDNLSSMLTRVNLLEINYNALNTREATNHIQQTALIASYKAQLDAIITNNHAEASERLDALETDLDTKINLLSTTTGEAIAEVDTRLTEDINNNHAELTEVNERSLLLDIRNLETLANTVRNATEQATEFKALDLEELINVPLVPIYGALTLKQLKTYTDFKVGMYLKTAGLNVVGDRGHNDYQVINRVDGEPADGYGFIDVMDGSLQLKALFIGETIRPEQLGCFANNDLNNLLELQRTFNYSNKYRKGIDLGPLGNSFYFSGTLHLKVSNVFRGLGKIIGYNKPLTDNTELFTKTTNREITDFFNKRSVSTIVIDHEEHNHLVGGLRLANVLLTVRRLVYEADLGLIIRGCHPVLTDGAELTDCQFLNNGPRCSAGNIHFIGNCTFSMVRNYRSDEYQSFFGALMVIEKTVRAIANDGKLTFHNSGWDTIVLFTGGYLSANEVIINNNLRTGIYASYFSEFAVDNIIINGGRWALGWDKYPKIVCNTITVNNIDTKWHSPQTNVDLRLGTINGATLDDF